MKSNKWLEIQNSTNNCTTCTNTIAECRCPKKQGGGGSNHQGSNGVQNNPELDSQNTNPRDTEQLTLSLRDPDLRPSNEFLLRFTPEPRKTEENEEDKADSKELGAYAALVPFKQIIEEFEKYLEQIANEQKITVDQLKEQGYRHEMSGNTLILYFGKNKAHAETFAKMLENQGMAKKLEPEAEAQHQQDNSEENTESTAPSPFGRPGRIPELSRR